MESTFFHSHLSYPEIPVPPVPAGGGVEVRVRLSAACKAFLYDEYLAINGSTVAQWRDGAKDRRASLSQVVDRIVIWYASNYPEGRPPPRLIIGAGPISYHSSMRISGASTSTLKRVAREFGESPMERVLLTWVLDRNRENGTGGQ